MKKHLIALLIPALMSSSVIAKMTFEEAIQYDKEFHARNSAVAVAPKTSGFTADEIRDAGQTNPTSSNEWLTKYNNSTGTTGTVWIPSTATMVYIETNQGHAMTFPKVASGGQFDVGYSHSVQYGTLCSMSGVTQVGTWSGTKVTGGSKSITEKCPSLSGAPTITTSVTLRIKKVMYLE